MNTRTTPRLLALALAAALAACSEPAQLDPQKQVGPDPVLPAARDFLMPPMQLEASELAYLTRSGPEARAPEKLFRFVTPEGAAIHLEACHAARVPSGERAEPSPVTFFHHSSSRRLRAPWT